MSDKIKPAVAMNEAVKTINEIKLDLADQISKYRSDNELSQHQMYELSGLNQVYVSKIERGKHGMISLERLLSACISLGLNPSLSLKSDNPHIKERIIDNVSNSECKQGIERAISLLAIEAIKARIES